PVLSGEHGEIRLPLRERLETRSCESRRIGTRAAQGFVINNFGIQESTMNTNTISFQTIDPSILDDVNGGFDFGRMVNAGNSNVATGATAGGALGGTAGAIAGGIAGGTVAGAPTMGLGAVGGVLAGAAAGGTA